jgi:hypothetical protein
VEFFKTLGVAILVLGLVTASVVYLSGEKHSASGPLKESTPDQTSSWKDGTLAPEDLKGSSRTIEMNYGKVAVLILEWQHHWQELKPHQWLAISIATSAILIAACCFLAARRLLQRRI